MPKSKKPTVQTFYDPVYGKHFEILLTGDIDEASSFLDVIVDQQTEARFFVDEDKQSTIRMWFKDWNINSFAHEASHAADYVMDMCGVDDHEARAYYLGFIVESIYDLTS